MNPVTVVILTFNESVNIRQAIGNTVSWAQAVFVLDSGSQDDTVEIAKSMGAQVFHRAFDNYAAQRNHAIKELPFATEWMLFLDADEYLTEALKAEISDLLAGQPEHQGYYLKRRFYFMGKWIRYGGYYPTWLLRLFRRDAAYCEREINEHIRVKGTTGKLLNDFADNNQKDFTDWLNKHNKYATFEAEQLALPSQNLGKLTGSQAERKQWIRERIWSTLLPPLIRPFFYFIYRYFIRLGFLDGKTGFIFHFMHALAYQFIIDVKYIEIKLKNKQKQ
ncbi:MAG: glycosyltransferase family 2 protein [Chitinophagales bacterium]|nr:glycosyltransferase family 2 protein [Chitinophagales bacterium]